MHQRQKRCVPQVTCLRLWVSNLTDVSTWRGCVQVAFVIDGFALDPGLARVDHGAPGLRVLLR